MAAEGDEVAVLQVGWLVPPGQENSQHPAASTSAAIPYKAPEEICCSRHDTPESRLVCETQSRRLKRAWISFPCFFILQVFFSQNFRGLRTSVIMIEGMFYSF